MLGNLVNVSAIIVGGFAGILCRKIFRKEILESVLKVVGIVVLIFGLIGVIKSMITIEAGTITSHGELLLLVAMVVGAFLGEWMRLDDHLLNVGKRIEKKINRGAFSKGFITASIIFCIGAMAIIGSVNAASGDHSILYLKAAIDGITAMILASTLGIGVVFSSIVVFLYQGSIVLLSWALGDFISLEFMNSFNAVGYTIIACIGLNFLQGEKLKIANLIPSLLIVIIYYLFLLG
ncbi:MAG: DUF554 domain-containing protein [Bacilli bacterium]